MLVAGLYLFQSAAWVAMFMLLPIVVLFLLELVYA